MFKLNLSKSMIKNVCIELYLWKVLLRYPAWDSDILSLISSDTLVLPERSAGLPICNGVTVSVTVLQCYSQCYNDYCKLITVFSVIPLPAHTSKEERGSEHSCY